MIYVLVLALGLILFCFYFHFTCHALLKLNVVIFNTVTFVIAQKWSVGKQQAAQCDLLKWKMFPRLENHTWSITPLSNTMFKSWENIRCKEILEIESNFVMSCPISYHVMDIITGIQAGTINKKWNQDCLVKEKKLLFQSLCYKTGKTELNTKLCSSTLWQLNV